MILFAILCAIGETSKDTGKATTNAVPQAIIHLKIKLFTKPRFEYVTKKVITKVIIAARIEIKII